MKYKDFTSNFQLQFTFSQKQKNDHRRRNEMKKNTKFSIKRSNK